MTQSKPNNHAVNKRLKQVEIAASLGLLLLCAGLIAPFAAPNSIVAIEVCKWIYAVGAVVYTVARFINVAGTEDSRILRRMRRMLGWAGICFCVGAAFWFWNQSKYGNFGLSLATMRDTVAFTLAGAIIQIVGSWRVAMRMKRESTERILDPEANTKRKK